jgi:hypothetical protein
LTLLTAGVASRERHVRGIGQWVAEHADDLIATLTPSHGRLPRTATLRRALRTVDVAALDERFTRVARRSP